MGLPEFFWPEDGVAGGGSQDILHVPEHIARRAEAVWRQARAAWMARPPAGTETEMLAIRRTLACMLEVLGAFEGRSLRAIREFSNLALRRVLHEELATADLERKLALRQLAQAIDHYGTVMEATAPFTDVSSWSHGETAVAAAELSVEDFEPPEPVRALGRATGALLLAFDTLKSDADHEFRHWSRQALEHWRTVSADLGSLQNLVRAAQIHHEARTAWDDWDDDDRRTELEAWKALQ
jgi:hypothetical protein